MQAQVAEARGYENPSMVALKPGYALLVLIARGVPHEARTVTTWEYNNQTVRMKRAPDSELPNTVSWATTYADQTASEKTPCGWKRIPRFLVALHRMQSASSRLQFLLMNDAVFLQKRCGSPRTFFAPYLQ